VAFLERLFGPSEREKPRLISLKKRETLSRLEGSSSEERNEEEGNEEKANSSKPQ